jgi:hypothetical protein
MRHRAQVGDVYTSGPIPDNVTWIDDGTNMCALHERGSDGLWHMDGVGTDDWPWPLENIIAAFGPVKVHAVQDEPPTAAELWALRSEEQRQRVRRMLPPGWTDVLDALDRDAGLAP